MTTAPTRTITLSADDAARVDALVASGQYPNQAAVISDAIDGLVEYDDAFENWVREAVVPVCQDVAAGFGTFKTPEQVLVGIEARRQAAA